MSLSLSSLKVQGYFGYLKAAVRPSISVESSSAHPRHADGKSCEVLKSAQHFWSFTAKQRCNILLNN